MSFYRVIRKIRKTISGYSLSGYAGSTLRKHTFSNILKISPPKTESFSDKNSDIFQISLPYQGSSNEYPQSMFLSRNKKNNVYPCKPQFYYIKVGFKGLKLYRYFLDENRAQRKLVHGDVSMPYPEIISSDYSILQN